VFERAFEEKVRMLDAIGDICIYTFREIISLKALFENLDSEVLTHNTTGSSC
jgi:hypothetical protein